MENERIIESPQNPRVKTAVKLRKSSFRRKQKKTLIEGFREIARAFHAGWKFNELYYTPSLFLDPAASALIQKIAQTGIPIFQCSESAFHKMSYRDTPDGLLALSPLAGKPLSEIQLPENPLLLIAEQLEKPGNLGTLLRTADAAGVDAVIVCDPRTDINNPNVIRASMGTLFFMPIAEASSQETLQWLKEKKIQPVSAFPSAQKEYTQLNLKIPTAIIVGAEDEGLSPLWEAETNGQARIPMLGKNDSLNVSTAAAIFLYEAVRQRRGVAQ
jgi:TrmH family RNA methyltransferase